MLAVVLLGIFGLMGLQGREFKIIGNRKVRGETARVLGGILLIGAIAAACAEFSGSVGSVSLAGISSYVCIGAFLIVVMVGLISATTDEQEIKQRGGLLPIPARNPDNIICPKCRFEQWSGTSECEKCGTRLFKLSDS